MRAPPSALPLQWPRAPSGGNRVDAKPLGGPTSGGGRSRPARGMRATGRADILKERVTAGVSRHASRTSKYCATEMNTMMVVMETAMTMIVAMQLIMTAVLMGVVDDDGDDCGGGGVDDDECAVGSRLLPLEREGDGNPTESARGNPLQLAPGSGAPAAFGPRCPQNAAERGHSLRWNERANWFGAQ
ncbi:unnamed protein product [Lampetra fluviatilis]